MINIMAKGNTKAAVTTIKAQNVEARANKVSTFI
jgi:hypothetical protein